MEKIANEQDINPDNRLQEENEKSMGRNLLNLRDGSP